MKLGQLKKKVIREFTKSPAKTIILIALCPVALYFVVPLIWRGTAKVNDAQRAKVIAQEFAPSTTPLASFSPVPPVSPGPTWNQLNRWIEADWRRQPGTIAEEQRNPFQTLSVQVEAVSEAPPEEPVASPAFSREAFASLGLKLTGTMVGRHSRSATINGRRYVEGSIVEPRRGERPASPAEQAIVLKHVGSRHAILEVIGERFRLELDATQRLGNGVTVVRRPANAAN